jgi:hypothetical protein
MSLPTNVEASRFEAQEMVACVYSTQIVTGCIPRLKKNRFFACKFTRNSRGAVCFSDMGQRDEIYKYPGTLVQSVRVQCSAKPITVADTPQRLEQVARTGDPC